MQPARIAALLRSLPGGGRPPDQLRRELASSLCFGVFLPAAGGGERQVGYARVVVDSAGTYHLGDVVIDEAFRGRGLGTALVRAVVSDERLRRRFGTLETENAHRLYEKAGFERCGRERMHRRPHGGCAEKSGEKGDVGNAAD